MFLPNSELVALAWLGSATGLSSAIVSTRLPREVDRWASTGFVTLGDGTGSGGGVVGGSPDRHTVLRNPVLSLHCWAVNPSSGKPPWGRAAHLAEVIVAATRDEAGMRRALVLPAGYGAARVQEAYVVGEPTRVPGDQGSYAHFSLNLQLHWVSLA